MNRQIVTFFSLVCAAGLWPTFATAADQPETVMVTFHAKPRAETELARVIANHWRTANELHLVAAAPHVTLRGTEEGNRTYFIEVFTWRDASIPDVAPPAIQKIWTQMNALVESRGGHAGLRFEEVLVVE